MRSSLPTRARRKAVADELARIEGDLQALQTRLRIDREIASQQTKRDLGNAVVLISKAHRKIADAVATERRGLID